jgi:hypothetical protein
MGRGKTGQRVHATQSPWQPATVGLLGPERCRRRWATAGPGRQVTDRDLKLSRQEPVVLVFHQVPQFFRDLMAADETERALAVIAVRIPGLAIKHAEPILELPGFFQRSKLPLQGVDKAA